MTSSTEPPPDCPWLPPVLRLLAILAMVVLSVYAAVNFARPPHGDERFYLDLLGVSGAGDFPVVLAGRTLSVLSSIALVVLTRRWCRSTLHLSDMALLLVTATLCIAMLTQREPLTMAIADPIFSLLIVATVIGMERAVTCRRHGLAAAAGAGWAAACLLRPLGFLYSPAIVLGLAAIAWGRPAGDRVWRTIAVIVVTAAGVMAAAQATSLVVQGRLASENKRPPSADVDFAEIRYLSLLRHAERGWPPAPREAQVGPQDVRLYRQEHGAASLPRTTGQRMIWSFRDMPAMAILSAAISTTYMVLRTGGILAPLLLVLMLSLPRHQPRAVVFPVLISVGYVSALGLVVNAYLETRWFYAVTCLVAGLGGFAFDRLAAAKPTAAWAVAVLQAAFLAASLAAAVIHSWPFEGGLTPQRVAVAISDRPMPHTTPPPSAHVARN